MSSSTAFEIRFESRRTASVGELGAAWLARNWAAITSVSGSMPARVVEAGGRGHGADAALAKALGFELDARSLLGSDRLVASVADKAALFAATGAVAVDMESHAVARAAAAAGLPFLAVRVIADPADAAIPPAAHGSVGPRGEVRVMATLLGLLRRPQDLPALLALGRASASAHDRLRALGLARRLESAHLAR